MQWRFSLLYWRKFWSNVKVKRCRFDIWNEVVMCMRYNIDAFDKTLKDLMHNNMALAVRLCYSQEICEHILSVALVGPERRFSLFNSKKFPYFHFLRCSVFRQILGYLHSNRTLLLMSMASRFQNVLLKVRNRFFPQTKEGKIKYPPFVNRKDSTQNTFLAVITELMQNYQTTDW